MARWCQVVYPWRQPSEAFGAAQQGLSRCVAWRIIPVEAGSLGWAAMLAAANMVTAPPAQVRDGMLPVWVRLADSDGVQRPGMLYVDGDGWNTEPTGPNWTIEFVVGDDGSTTDRFAFVVEMVDDVRECGQVDNADPVGTRDAWKTFAPGAAIATNDVLLSSRVPRWATRGVIVCDAGGGAQAPFPILLSSTSPAGLTDVTGPTAQIAPPAGYPFMVASYGQMMDAAPVLPAGWSPGLVLPFGAPAGGMVKLLALAPFNAAAVTGLRFFARWSR